MHAEESTKLLKEPKSRQAKNSSVLPRSVTKKRQQGVRSPLKTPKNVSSKQLS